MNERLRERLRGALRRWPTVLRVVAAIAVCAPALWMLSLELRVFAGRVGYPADIEWLEGATLYQGFRVMHGQITYGPPQVGYLPIFHPPLYPTVLGGIGFLQGSLDYSTGRTLSFVSFLVSAALFVRVLVRDETEREEHGRPLEGLVAGLLAVGIAAGAVPLLSGFYDLIREDAMALAIVTLAAVVADTKRMRRKRIVALAMLITAAIYTRLPIVFFLVWIVIFVFARNRRAGIWLALTSLGLCAVVLLGLLFASKGWYWIYTVSLVQGHHILRERFLIGLKMVHTYAPFIAAVPVVAIGLAIARRLSARSVLWVGMLICAIPVTLLPFSKVGGFANDFMPIPLYLGPATLFVAADLARAFRKHPRVTIAVRWAGFAGLAVFLCLRFYDASKFIPTQDAWRRAERLNTLVAGLEGGVIAPRLPFIPMRNGHDTRQWSDMPYLDAVWAGFSDLQLGRYVDKANARWAIIAGDEIPYSAREIAARYQLERPLSQMSRTLIGEYVEPRYLLRKLEDESNARVLFDFEAPTHEGWVATGDAFAGSPTTAKPPKQGAISGVIGTRLANSFHVDKKDKAKGTLASPEFVIDRPNLAFRLGGGWSKKTRVELRVGGRLDRQASSVFRNSEIMLRIVWDVSKHMGKKAQIVLVDEDDGNWAHLICDHFVLF
jgi:hypothetical protein